MRAWDPRTPRSIGATATPTSGCVRSPGLRHRCVDRRFRVGDAPQTRTAKGAQAQGEGSKDRSKGCEESHPGEGTPGEDAEGGGEGGEAGRDTAREELKRARKEKQLAVERYGGDQGIFMPLAKSSQ